MSSTHLFTTHFTRQSSSAIWPETVRRSIDFWPGLRYLFSTNICSPMSWRMVNFFDTNPPLHKLAYPFAEYPRFIANWYLGTELCTSRYYANKAEGIYKENPYFSSLARRLMPKSILRNHCLENVSNFRYWDIPHSQGNHYATLESNAYEYALNHITKMPRKCTVWNHHYSGGLVTAWHWWWQEMNFSS